MSDQPIELAASIAREYGDQAKPDDVLDVARRIKFTGAVTFHLIGGVPKIAETGKPFRIPIIGMELDKQP